MPPVESAQREAAREIIPDETIDLVGVPCPRNSTLATLRLDQMEEGEVLEMLLGDGEAITTFVPNLRDEGYEILEQSRLDEQRWRVLVRC